ncbi:iron transporter [Halobacterium zhouii]|uniref:iron transporter n=1 Tax=Halobacterium zhouii TaxID=2902624 RepID=UPI001E2D2402|nr:iron transporter [Halobacterium zhouii]
MSDTKEKVPSDEVDETQLQLAEKMGEAFMEGVEYMITEVAHTGDTKEAGEYVVGFAQEEAEGLWALEDGEFSWHEPGDANCHVEVVVVDAADERLVPRCDVSFSLEGDSGEHGPFDAELLWHPGIYHYGANVELPESGTYDLHVTVDPPTFHRHDEKNGDRFGERTEVTFSGVDIETGQD